MFDPASAIDLSMRTFSTAAARASDSPVPKMASCGELLMRDARFSTGVAIAIAAGSCSTLVELTIASVVLRECIEQPVETESFNPCKPQIRSISPLPSGMDVGHMCGSYAQ